MGVMNAWIVDLRENILIVCQEKIKFSMVKVKRSTNHSIKQVTVAEKGVNRCKEEEPLGLDAEMNKNQD